MITLISNGIVIIIIIAVIIIIIIIIILLCINVFIPPVLTFN
jgi:hypothetical protein